MPLLVLPLDLPGEDVTTIMEDMIHEMLADFEEGARSTYSDGIFPGTHPIKGDMPKLANFLEVTDPQDYAKLFDENYLLRLENGLDAPPVSPFWLNQLSVRSSFDRNRREFVRLINQLDRPTLKKFNV